MTPSSRWSGQCSQCTSEHVLSKTPKSFPNPHPLSLWLIFQIQFLQPTVQLSFRQQRELPRADVGLTGLMAGWSQHRASGPIFCHRSVPCPILQPQARSTFQGHLPGMAGHGPVPPSHPGYRLFICFPRCFQVVQNFLSPDTPSLQGVCVWALRPVGLPQAASGTSGGLGAPEGCADPGKGREPWKRKSRLCGWSLRRPQLDPGAGPGSSAAPTSCPWLLRWPWMRLCQWETSAATGRGTARRQGGERHFRPFWRLEV